MTESHVAELDELPLAVDLDGTLLLTDVLHESCLQLLRNRPALISVLPFRWAEGKAELKDYVADRTDLSVENLPYNQPLIDWLSEEKKRGRQLLLCTASCEKYAQKIAEHLQLFDEVMSTTGSRNLSGSEKASAL